MSEISRTSLFGKLDSTAYKAIESATLFCKMRGNPFVELSHWIHQILQQDASDLRRILTHFDVDAARLAKDLTQSLDRLPRGATSVSDLSMHVEESVERGWVYASLMFGVGKVRTGHLLVGWLKTPSLRNQLNAMSREFAKLDGEKIAGDFAAATHGSCEQDSPTETATASSDGTAPAVLGKQDALRKYSVDLVAQAKGADPIVGRDEEIRQLIQVLLRRRQNNPILTGEAGVGKTAVVEGFAQRIASGDVPPALQGVELRSLDIGLLQAGASMKGEFESRLRHVIDEVQAATTPVILFIDEAHTLVGAGGKEGTGDAANLLKPALARGKLRTVAATTWAEYKKYIEPDPALTRRFQVVQVDEPNTVNAVRMLRATSGALESHHKIQVLDEALEAAVSLSKRFIPERQLPDKAVSLLDTACARVAVSQHGVPPEVEDCRRMLSALKTESQIVQRELDVGGGSAARLGEIKALSQVEQKGLDELEARWSSEKSLIGRILEIRATLRATSSNAEQSPEADRTALLQEQDGLQAELQQLQGETPMILASVGAPAIAAVVADWTGIPMGRMAKSEIETVLSLAEHLESRVIGQGHALKMIARRIQTARAGLENPSKPIGVFLLAGPSGVGKTETAMSLGEALYGGEQNVITINMSEFQEAHSVSTLKGAPPGYVGFGEGGVLTEAVRRRPYSVVLLDEVEKAHPDVHEIFFQVFDKGWMEDGQGVRIDFRNTIIILTSNVGSDVVMDLCSESRPEPEVVTEAIRPALGQAFPAALIGRMVTIPYYPLNDDVLGTIVRLQLNRVSTRVKERYGVPLSYDDSVVQLIISRCTELESGGRMIDAVLTNTLLPEISQELLMRTLDGEDLLSVGVKAENGKFNYEFA